MIHKWTTLLLLLIALGCQSTSLSTTWKDPQVGVLSMKKVIVVVLNSTAGERRAQEDVLASQIKRAVAVPSYTLIPDDQLNDVARAKQRIAAEGFDGAIVLRLIDAKSATTYVPATVSTWDEGWISGHRDSGYLKTDTIVRAEVNLYRVADGKLLWTGFSETMNPSDARGFAGEIAKAAATELRKQGLLD